MAGRWKPLSFCADIKLPIAGDNGEWFLWFRREVERRGYQREKKETLRQRDALGAEIRSGEAGEASSHFKFRPHLQAPFAAPVPGHSYGGAAAFSLAVPRYPLSHAPADRLSTGTRPPPGKPTTPSENARQTTATPTPAPKKDPPLPHALSPLRLRPQRPRELKRPHQPPSQSSSPPTTLAKELELRTATKEPWRSLALSSPSLALTLLDIPSLREISSLLGSCDTPTHARKLWAHFTGLRPAARTLTVEEYGRLFKLLRTRRILGSAPDQDRWEAALTILSSMSAVGLEPHFWNYLSTMAVAADARNMRAKVDSVLDQMRARTLDVMQPEVIRLRAIAHANSDELQAAEALFAKASISTDVTVAAALLQGYIRVPIEACNGPRIEELYRILQGATSDSAEVVAALRAHEHYLKSIEQKESSLIESALSPQELAWLLQDVQRYHRNHAAVARAFGPHNPTASPPLDVLPAFLAALTTAKLASPAQHLLHLMRGYALIPDPVSAMHLYKTLSEKRWESPAAATLVVQACARKNRLEVAEVFLRDLDHESKGLVSLRGPLIALLVGYILDGRKVSVDRVLLWMRTVGVKWDERVGREIREAGVREEVVEAKRKGREGPSKIEYIDKPVAEKGPRLSWTCRIGAKGGSMKRCPQQPPTLNSLCAIEGWKSVVRDDRTGVDGSSHIDWDSNGGADSWGGCAEGGSVNDRRKKKRGEAADSRGDGSSSIDVLAVKAFLLGRHSSC
ncbi:hypothetical protein BDK51DRAFT_39097 [Blyttiomyces helicus]|uniref:Pentacotripeptide-repeat region of PRORP domain-containing protein n=1 Tax=Blyttiomyces helicus TaxID=388810 RepID=A0A4P9WPH8_9FUNG|nr:hypothetical protein BDK51DRAFT_39097 [Blyttiomyces helicus]|eukprot:RKO93648.1 hypothetical protein BDK51DRAFT_39097 [Blyttiomyces helicus]